MKWLGALALIACSGGSGNPDGGPSDAPLAPCGIEEPGTRCKSSTVLERCVGVNRVETDCAALGQLCGASPNDPTGAACVIWGQSCGLIDVEGVCEGDILTVCEDADLRVFDCAARGGHCALIGPRHDCTDACRDANVGAEGTCNAALTAINHCKYADGQYTIGEDGCPDGTFCKGAGVDSRMASCEPLCTGIGIAGRCEDDMLMRCQGTTIITTNCADTGQVCAYLEGDGYVCANPGAVGTRVVRGRIRYEDRVPTDGMLGPLTPAPVRGASVALVAEATGRVIATAATNGLGDYFLRYDIASGTKLHVLVVSASLDTARRVRVLRPDGLLHALASPTFDAAGTVVQDILVTERSGLAEAFNILDVLVAGQDTIRTALGLTAPVPVIAVWSLELRLATGIPTGTDIIQFQGKVEDDDGYDDSVIAHELGHIIEIKYGRTSNPRTPHFPGQLLTPTKAWSEGFANWVGGTVRQNPVYMDTRSLGSFFFNIDDEVHSVEPDLPQTQLLSENTVSEILWDLSDAPSLDDDPVAGTAAEVMLVEPLYLRDLPSDRGVPGVDLVDFLDGYLVVNGAGRCAEDAVVIDSRSFPYDFGGPVTCQ